MSTEIDWSAVAHEFEWDGSLRDMYVQDTSVTEWQVVLDAIRTRYPPLTFLAGGVPSELPEIAAEVFPLGVRRHTESDPMIVSLFDDRRARGGQPCTATGRMLSRGSSANPRATAGA